MKWFIFIFISIFAGTCSVAKEDKSFANAIRLFLGTYQAPTALKLSIKGQLKDAKGNVMANTLLSQSTGINTGLALRATDKVLRCADYSLKGQQVQCIKIIKLKNLAKKASDSCYIIYTGMPGYLKEKQIAKFSNIASDKEISYYFQESFTNNGRRVSIHSCSGEYLAEDSFEDTAAGTITDKNGNYTLKLDAGEVSVINVKTPAADVGSMQIDLTEKTSKEDLEPLKDDASKLPITLSPEIQTTPEVSGVVETTAGSNTSTNTTTDTGGGEGGTTVSGTDSGTISLDPATLLETANATLTLPSLVFPQSSYSLTVGTAVTNMSPAVTGTLNSCSISPALPSGLSFNTTTCEITGNPATVLTTTNYTITASNSAGSTNITLSILVSLPSIANLTFNVVPGTYSSDQSISISTTTPGVSIYYTIDASTPTTASTLYTAPISVAGNGTSITIKALAIKTGMQDSAIISGTYTVYYNSVVMPTFSPVAGTYTGVQSVSISSTTAGASIRYTTDGTVPTCSTGTLYSSAVAISTISTLKAIACNAGMLDSSVASGAYTIQYTVGGNVSGLTGTVVLQNNGGDDKTISADGAFTFASVLNSGTAYSVTILTQPTGQICSVTNGSGTASSNITNITVTCSATTHTVGGTVSGLSGTVVLQNNSGDNKTITANGAYTFTTSLAYNSSYNVTVMTQPTGQNCTVAGGSGNITANVTNANITCSTNTYTVGGTLTGFSSGSIVLLNNSGDNLTLTADGAFTFATPINYNTTYQVTVLGHPTGKTCMLSNNKGTITANVNNVAINCVAGVNAIWARTVTSSAENTSFNRVAVDSSGNIIVVGRLTGTSAIDFGGSSTAVNGVATAYSGLVVKYDSNGNALWAKTIASPSTSLSEFYDVVVDASDNIYVVGVASGADVVYFGDSITATGVSVEGNPVLIKYNSSGVTQWAKIVTPSTSTGRALYNSLIMDTTGNIYVVGYIYGGRTWTFDTGKTAAPTYANENFVIVKYDSAGAVQWVNSIASATTGSTFSDIAIDTATSDIYAVGYINGAAITFDFGNSITVAGTAATNPVIVKYNTGGLAQWAKSLVSGTGGASFNSVAFGSGTVYAAGYILGTTSQSFGTVSVTGVNANSGSPLLIKYNSSTGADIWAKTATVNNSANNTVYYNEISLDASENVYAVGYIFANTLYDFGAGGIMSNYSATNLVKYDSAGNNLWAKTNATGYSSNFYGVKATTGGIYAVGLISYNNFTYTFDNGISVTGTNQTGYANWGQNCLLVKFQ